MEGSAFKSLLDWGIYQGQSSQHRATEVQTSAPATVLNSGVVVATVMWVHLQIEGITDSLPLKTSLRGRPRQCSRIDGRKIAKWEGAS